MSDSTTRTVFLSERVNGFERMTPEQLREAIASNLDHPVFRAFWQMILDGLGNANADTRDRGLDAGARAHACGYAAALDDLVDGVSAYAGLQVERGEGE